MNFLKAFKWSYELKNDLGEMEKVVLKILKSQ